MTMDDRITLTGRDPGPCLTALTVAEELGWSVARLLGHIATGSLPPPAVVGGIYTFTLRYALNVRCNGLSLPGTYPGLPAGGKVERKQRDLNRAAVRNANRRAAKRLKQKPTRRAGKGGGK